MLHHFRGLYTLLPRRSVRCTGGLLRWLLVHDGSKNLRSLRGFFKLLEFKMSFYFRGGPTRSSGAIGGKSREFELGGIAMKVRILRKAMSRAVLGIAGALWLLVSTGATQAQEQHALRSVDNLKVIDANNNLVGFVIAPGGKPGGWSVGSTVAFVLGQDLFLVDLTPNNFIRTKSGLLFPTTDCTGTAHFIDRQQALESNGSPIPGTLVMNDGTVFVVDSGNPPSPVTITYRSAFYSQLCQLFELEQAPLPALRARMLLNLDSLFRPPFRLR